MPDVIYLSTRKPRLAPRVIRQSMSWRDWVAVWTWIFVLGAACAVVWWGCIAIALWLHHIAELAIR